MLSGIRIVFDSNLNRDYQNMPCCIKLNEQRFKLPKTLIKDFDITLTDADGNETVMTYRNYHNRLFVESVSGEYVSVKLTPINTYGSDDFAIFDFEVF